MIDINFEVVIGFILGGGGIYLFLRSKILKKQRDIARKDLEKTKNIQKITKKVIKETDEIVKKEQETRKALSYAKTFADLFNIYNLFVRQDTIKRDNDRDTGNH